MSAAVIGRQLRQQTTRTSGPLPIPQSQYKGRPRTHSNVYNRPFSPSASGIGETVYPYIHHSRFEEEKTKPDQSTEPQLKCTWHCFCVALKALSGGIVLLIVGSFMTAAGFMAEENLLNTANKFPNGSLSDPHDMETLAAYRNLSFAGPVLLGLGLTVVLAALILTFEGRDTLGIKVAPTKVTSVPTKTIPTSDIAVISSSSSPLAALNQSEPSSTSKTKMMSSESSLSLPLSSFLNTGGDSSENEPGSNRSGFSKNQLQETIMETNLSEASAYGTTGSGQSPDSPTAGPSKTPVKGSEKVRTGFVSREECINDNLTTNRTRESHSNKTTFFFDLHSPPPPTSSYSNMFRTDSSSNILSPSDKIDHFYFGLPSPQETVLSDPEGCSLELPSSWKSARCSASTSSPNSVSLSALDLFYSSKILPGESNDTTSTSNQDTRKEGQEQQNLKQQQLESKLLAQQQLLNEQHQQQLALQQRLLQEQQDRIRREVHGTKTIASIESDGLSSSSSGGGGTGMEEERNTFSRDSSFERSKTRQTTSSSSSAASGSTVVNYRSRSDVRSGGAHNISFTTT